MKNIILKSLVAKAKTDLILTEEKIKIYEELLLKEDNSIQEKIEEIEKMKKQFLENYEESKEEVYFYKILILTELIDILNKN